MAYDFLAQRFAQRQPQLAQPFDLGAALGFGSMPMPPQPPPPAPVAPPPVAPGLGEEDKDSGVAAKRIAGAPAADDSWNIRKGLGSAAKGASIGASVGSVVPGVGTVVGGLIGGVGGFLSSLF